MKNLRYYIFWLIDFLKGSPIKRHFSEIQKGFSNLEELESIQKNRSNEILKYAKENVPFYASFDETNLQSFPIITKQDILNAGDSIFSKDYVGKKESLHLMTTSGSSGTPFKMYQNQDKVLRNRADVLFYYSIADYHVGSRLYYLRIWNDLNKRSKSEQLKSNIISYDTTNIGEQAAKKFVQTMVQDKSEKTILAYASSLVAFMEHINEARKDWNLNAIFAGSEELPIQVKRKMETIFECPIISRYANQENGILAQQPVTGEDYFELNESSYVFEFLKPDSDKIAAPGELARIVITDLFNKAIPIIRYDTGDLCKYSFKNGRRVIDSIEGRKADSIKDVNGNLISYGVVSWLFRRHPEVAQFQLIQKELDYIQINLVHRIKEDEKLTAFDDIKFELKKILGDKVQVDIIEKEHIPIEKTGKFRYIKSYV